MGSQVVGTAYVRLKLLTDTIGKDIEKSVKNVDFQDVHIQVDADTLKADAELEATKVKADELNGKSPRITPKVDTKDAKKEINALWTAIALLGPTIGPLGAVAAGAFGALAAEAGVAVLAVQGVKKEMKDGTAVGAAFGSGIQLIKSDLATLGATAARGILPGFQQTVTALNTAMPGVNKSVASLSAILGDIGSHVIVGLVAGLQTFSPLLTHIAAEADVAAGHFQAWATGPGGAQFAQSLGTQFDKVVPVLVHLAEAVAKLVAAFVPVGDHIVGIIGALADAINAIPLPVLKVLADVFVTLYSASRLLILFKNLSISLAAMGASSGVASAGLSRLALSTAAFTAALGPVAAALVTGYAITQTFGDQLDKLANKFATGKIAASVNSGAMDELRSVYFDATHDVNDTAESILHFAVSGKLAGQGIGGISDKVQQLVPHFKALGVTSNDVESGVSGTDAAFQALISTINQHGGATKQDIDTLNELHKTFANTEDAINSTAAVLQALANAPGWGALKTSKDSIAQVGAKFGLSADAVKNYAAVLGISDAAIKSGVVTNQQLAAAVQTVSSAYNTATATGAGFLDSLQKFSTSAGTAADRAQLIGAYLKAAQGDLLSYSGAVASAYQANTALTNAFKQQADQVKAGSLALGDTERAAINLKTGMIDLSRAGAGPLIQQLQGMQDAAMNAAAATFQHEVATRGAGKAAQDAATIFKTQTYDALVKDATQLGLTTQQAQRLANSYFALPKDVATKVRAIGTDPVISVLHEIANTLLSIAHMTPHPTISVRDNASTQIDKIQQNLRALRDKTIDITTYVQNVILPTLGTPSVTHDSHHAVGGLVRGRGSGTSDSIPAMLSNGEYVVRASRAAKYKPLLDSINSGRGGYAGGGTVDAYASTSGGGDWSGFAAMVAAEFRNMQITLVAENGGLPLAKAVNDANLRNARRMG